MGMIWARGCAGFPSHGIPSRRGCEEERISGLVLVCRCSPGPVREQCLGYLDDGDLGIWAAGFP